VTAPFDEIVRHVAHRPWPMPRGPWLMTQTWSDLLFAHWPVAPRTLATHVPPRFTLDLFDGTAWIGIVPFQMSNVGIRGVPWASAFPELNVRTYVRVGGRAGVYFFSLDAASAMAVAAARLLLNLPYYQATMTVSSDESGVWYASDRRRRDAGSAALRVEYQPAGPASSSAAGSLEYFLTERYCLYHVGRSGRSYRLDIHHRPWMLRSAHAQFGINTMTRELNIDLPTSAPLLHFSLRQDVVAWWPTPVESA
jgi:uncharacterized protein YqjF (DUF2071 family)